MNPKLLIIGQTYPEPSTTAAGGRMMQLIHLFLEAGYHITFASTANTNPHSESLDVHGVEMVSIELNNTSFDDFVARLNPSIVIFDRFVTEEKFGWRVAEQCPKALRILDTEDLHFLRNAREQSIKKETSIDLYTDIAKRELASILRSDLSLIISEYEMDVLTDTFQIPKGLLHYLPFLLEPIAEEEKEALPPFEERSGFMTIGNLLHAPNVDAVKHLKTDIWPAIRKQIPNETLSIYGNYGPEHINQLHNPKEGFLIKGWTSDIETVMKKARVCVAPLRFGAGLKGKLIDAMRFGTPAVTTYIGAEGIHGSLPYAGGVSDSVEAFVSFSIRLYSEKDLWIQSRENGYRILSERFQKQAFAGDFLSLVRQLIKNQKEHRRHHFLGQILQHQTTHTTKYMGKWIEAKNKK